MNELLDIGELVQENKRQESTKLSVFEEVLKRCHVLIKKYNKERIREMNYTIPHMILGKPKFDMSVLRNYLIYHLRDNGLKVEVLDNDDPDCNVLYISWKETDIDLSKYLNRKTVINNRGTSIYNIEQPSLRLGKEQSSSKQLDMLKFRQEKQKEILREREERFSLHKARMPQPEGSYQDYIKRF
jgi:hypothetical protein